MSADALDQPTGDRDEPIRGVGENADCGHGERADGLLAVGARESPSHHRIGHLGPSYQAWKTPRALWDALNAEFRFTLDAAASPENALCENYYTEADDALTKPWQGSVFVNPPYKNLYPWVQKAWRAMAIGGATVVMLLPASTDTKWFHDIVLHLVDRGYAEVRFIRGRLRFEGAKHPATFASMIVVFYPWKVTT